MPPPTNISFLTARDLGTITTSTQTFTQQIDDAGVNQTTYYSFIAPSGSVVVGAWGRVDISTVAIVTRPYVGPAGAPTQIITIAGTDVPIQFPVTALSTYFLECTPGAFVSSPTTLSLDVQLAPSGAVQAGSLAVNDDESGGYPLAILSGTADYTAVKFVNPFPFGEAGDTLIDGTSLWEDSGTGLVLFNPSFQQVTTAANTQTLRIRTCLGANKFYIGTNQNPTRVYTMTAGGTLAGPEVLTAMTSCSAVAAANDESIVYHSFTGTNQPIRTWDLVGHAAGANFVAGIANYSNVDILVLGDGTVLVGYYKSTVTRDYKVLHYSAAGATLNTYTFATPSSVAGPRLAYAIDDPNSFWVMTHPAATVGLTVFYNIKVSDGSILTTRNHAIFEGGAYTGTATLTPPARFGASFSCPFIVVRASASPTTTTFIIRRQRRWELPSSDDNKNVQIPTIEILGRGNGLTPGPDGSPIQGQDPIIMWRLSKNGGKTWLPERAIHAGLEGDYLARWRILQATGNYRNAVGEITVSDPVDWQMLKAMGTPTEGSS